MLKYISMVKSAKTEEKKIKELSSSKDNDGEGIKNSSGKLQTSLKLEIEKELAKSPKSISIIWLVDKLVEDAFKARSSDIHIDPAEKDFSIRFRIDGVLHEIYRVTKEIQPEVITRIKVLSGLRTDEHQTAQDGRFRIHFDNSNVDIRVSIAPTYYGENAVLRLLAEQAESFTLEALGFQGANLDRVKQSIKKPYGMILATGPTGSGKTTTLYTILKILNTKEVSIITIEDPIEYAIEGIEQIQANAKTGLTFASGLRSILRQDPNIIMVGEIRDEETAGIAVNAALTGHLLLSTLHTNDAPTTLPRLLDMNIEPFLIASTVNIAIGQRLVRQICSDCKAKKEITDDEFNALARVLPPKVLGEQKTFYYGTGCNVCDKSGYKGRIGIHEVLEIDDEIRSALMRNADAGEIRRIAVKNGMMTMIEEGFKKAKEGITTIEEILRVIHE